ncbi:MAG: hypothetical protein DWB45_00405 [Xanthomonadales bacterium]|nr:hypothetical protein [Xanthomonadales bacterium]MCC6595053.1 hypothetical protein [Rhodanobacteraceae bacterium]MDL1867943.1 hypothetical protein [Gammaproteobacteria bacterium PRO6]
MSTQPDYKINYSVAPPPLPRVDPAAPLYASEDGVVASLSNNECIFQVKRTGATHVMTYQVLQALDQTRQFRSLDEHVERVMSAVAGLAGQREGVLRVFDGLVKRGLLVSAAGFVEGCAASPARPVAALRAVFIRACNRPDQLAHLLATLADYERRHRANRQYVLIDDSSSREAANRHRDLLREFARATGCKLTYIGATESRRLVERMARAVPAAAGALARCALGEDSGGRFGGGRAWNLMLLLSAGARAVLLDDDHRFPLRRLDEARSGLDPDSSHYGVTRFHRNMDNALAAGSEVEADPFDLHLDALGQPLGALIQQPAYALDPASLRGLALNRLDHLRGGASVLATQHGSYGSSRTDSVLWLYQLPADQRAEFVRDRDSYLRNIEAASIWYGQLQANAQPTANFSPFALDNSVLLPCTNPHGRGEDALFSNLVSLCHADALALELPVAIGHVQETQRKRSPLTFAAHTPKFNYFVTDFVRRQLPQLNSSDPAQRLGVFVAHLHDMAGSSERGAVQQLKEYLAYIRSDLIERLQHQYDAATDAPIYWQADVRSIIEANGKALIANAAPRLGDWPEGVDEAACARLLREQATQLAELCAAWPALWNHAREQGERLLGAV